MRSTTSSWWWALVATSVLSTARAEDDRPSHAPKPAARADHDAPPERPPAGDADEKAKQLFAAIVHDDPARAADFFFPREAFLKVKAMAEPGRYHDRLQKRYEADIHALHESMKDRESAVFERFELARRGGWVRTGEEGNSLPYWAARHSFIHYRVGKDARKLEVRVLITWEDHWYITHLNEFH